MNADSTRRILSLLFIVAIAVVFTLSFGPGSSGFGARQDVGAAGPVAKVNEREIPARELTRNYQAQLQRYQGQGLSPEIVRQFVRPTDVLEGMIQSELLAQAAEQRGLVASDAELNARVRASPLFQNRDGRFDLKLYQQNVPGFLGKSVADFETELRRSLSAQKMGELVELGAAVSDDELKARFLKEGNTADVTFVRFLPSMYAGKAGAPTAAQLAAFRKEKEADLKAQYEQNQFMYSTPERVVARQIRLAVPENATDAQKAAVRERLEAIRKEAVEGGKDFAELARARSEDAATKARGGDLGEVDRGALAPAVADAAFGLQAGEVTPVLETPQGLVLVKVEQKKPAVSRSFEQVADELARERWTSEQAKVLARQAAEQALAQAQKGKALKDAFPAPKDAPEAGGLETEKAPQARDTRPFNAAAEAIPGLGPVPDLARDVFASEGPRTLPRVYPSGEGFVVAAVTERKRPSDADFTAQRDALRAQALQAKQYELRDAFLKELRKSGKVEIDNEAVTQAVGS
jgi:peptidyl-prolyl cis-trans isomerase D